MIKPKTPEKIHHEISELLSKGVSYIDALILYAARHDLEVEAVGEIVKKSVIMKEKIRAEAEELRMVNSEDDGKLC
jgi:hypothetical protein